MLQGLLLSGAIRAALVLAAGLVAYALLARAAASTRRFILVLTVGAALVVPIAAAVSPRWRVEAPAALSVFAHEAEPAPAATVHTTSPITERTAPAPAPVSSSTGGLDPTEALGLGWLLVAAALLARLGSSQLRARSLVRGATLVERGPWGDATHALAGRRVDVRVSAEIDSPVVTGLLYPTIVIPRDALGWTVDRCRLVLVHELAHVRRRDVLVQAIADVACALQWCNPLVWLCARKLRVECELAADDTVLAAGVQPTRYAEELLAVATSLRTPSAALAMAERGSLETRVASILAARPARAPLAARGTISVVAVGALLAAAAACATPELSSPPPMTPRTGTANDPAIQRAVDAELAAIATAWSPEVATIIVLDPATGEILANGGRRSGQPIDVGSMTAMAPGSTLKPVTIAAALETHAITPTQTFECGPGPRAYGDKLLQDASVNGTLDAAHILAVSSNIGASRIFDALGGANLASWLRRFHFGDPSSVPGAAVGAVPAQLADRSYEGAAAANGIGMTATPLEVIAAYGAIAGDGVYHAPTFDRGGSTPERILSSETASAVMTMLETAVVDETATGGAARVAGIHVAGKTGTAKFRGADGHDQTYASFVGVADLPSRRLVMLVGLQLRTDLSGGKTAAPAFARLVTRLRGN
ncbi:MAG: hypothetical protein IPQ07_16045 [Myxococcales bacterium]|nr:hypothetical protein [Myxococcales bacterium]